jgi:hypothetical protein
MSGMMGLLALLMSCLSRPKLATRCASFVTTSASLHEAIERHVNRCTALMPHKDLGTRNQHHYPRLAIRNMFPH